MLQSHYVKMACRLYYVSATTKDFLKSWKVLASRGQSSTDVVLSWYCRTIVVNSRSIHVVKSPRLS